MLLEAYDAKRHYPEMERCWKERGWIPCPQEALPRWGMVAEREDGSFLAYLGCYVDIGTIAVVDWAIRDPKAAREEADEALRALFDRAVFHARWQACRFLYSVTANRKWGAKLEAWGMAVAEENARSYIQALRPGRDTAFMKD